MKKFIVLGALLASTASLAAQRPVRVIDGDTIQVGQAHVRAADYDSPEMPPHSKCVQERLLAAQATDLLKELSSPPHVLTLKYKKGKDKYGRAIARFYSDHKPVAPIMIQAGLGAAYKGGKKLRTWCEAP